MQTILALCPLIWLLIALSLLRMKAWKAGLFGYTLAAFIALFEFGGMASPHRIIEATVSGLSLALYPICLVILAALYTYAITVESGAMKTIRDGLAGVSKDQRILALLIVWGFGNFIEGMAGFGTSVAIPASILVGIGFHPMKAILMCLVANTTPTAFGSVGIPLFTLATVSGTEPYALAWQTASLQALITALGPLLILLVLDGVKALKGLGKELLFIDAAFLVPWLLTARFLGWELPNVLGGLCVMVLIVLRAHVSTDIDLRAQAKAWLPFGLVVAVLMAAACLPADLKRYASPGVLILAAATVGGLLQCLGPGRILAVLVQTAWNYRTAFATICVVLAMARVMDESRMIATLADTLVTTTGDRYPFFAPVVGALGGFMTGSGTSANVLFGAMQTAIAVQIHVSPEVLAAANVMGAGIGKMICPQSIAIGAAAAGLIGRESDVFRKSILWFPAVLLVACLMTAVVS